ncbi:MAG TPA: DUF2147 domain-containing protein [Steroidobacteraceae bacterium]|jgi:uncharacterized protein (DUF2147 family)
MSLERKWLLLLLPVVLAASASAAELPGRWLTEPGDGIIEISQTADGSYQGRIIGGNAPGRVDAKNPDPARRQRLLLGQVILVGMRAEGPGSWSGGTIYDPDSGKTYKCHLEIIDADHLKVRGYIGVSLLGRSQTWTRYTGASLDLSAAPH